MRALVLIEGPLSDRRAGPEMRGWQIASALAARHTVTVAAWVDRPRAQGELSVIPATRASLLRAARRSDVLIAPWIPPYLFAALLWRGTRLVADLYDPADIELAGVAELHGRHASVRALTRLQLRFADAILCAGERQLSRIAALGPACGDRPLLTMPLGVPPPPPDATGHPLRERFGLGSDDTVVLWWGTPWIWLDVETAVRVFGRIAAMRPGVKLVICGAAPRDRDAERLTATARAVNLAETLSLEDTVFVLDEWVPYERRHEYLADADIGLTLHPGGEEARLAARARYTDYLWTGLPCVLTRGDELADRLAAEGLAVLVEPGDVEGIAEAIVRLADDPLLRRRAAEAGVALAAESLADDAADPLMTLLADPGFRAGRSQRRRRPGAVVAATLAYYGSQLMRRGRRPLRSAGG